MLSGKDKEFGEEVAAFQTALGRRVTEAGLRWPGTVGGSVAVNAVLLLGVLAVFVSAIVLLIRSFGGPLPLVLLVVGLAVGIIGVVLVSRVPLMAAGAELRDHLRGLELHIRRAEADRIAMVQSPRGADRRSVGPVEIMEVTERLLPWLCCSVSRRSGRPNSRRPTSTPARIPSGFRDRVDFTRRPSRAVCRPSRRRPRATSGPCPVRRAAARAAAVARVGAAAEVAGAACRWRRDGISQVPRTRMRVEARPERPVR
ncbi:hypothetical protein [Rathayibacter rathayi]|uniref:hypothetical protein n=1 Tax=Rathayibacter rathayi TaxID=33887 RepID=UPI0014794255|nr:hypothetical protein [Rathayibacter rathayi]